MTLDPLNAASEAAKAVWQDLVTVDPPVPVEERLNAVLDAYTTVLAASGCLVIPERAPTADELDTTARWLAKLSRFPRYTDGDGWQLLRRNPRDVEVAYAKARANLLTGEDDLAHALVAAFRMLVNAAENTTGAGR